MVNLIEERLEKMYFSLATIIMLPPPMNRSKLVSQKTQILCGEKSRFCCWDQPWVNGPEEGLTWGLKKKTKTDIRNKNIESEKFILMDWVPWLFPNYNIYCSGTWEEGQTLNTYLKLIKHKHFISQKSIYMEEEANAKSLWIIFFWDR